MRTRPNGESVFQAGPGWPPVILPTAVFWLTAVVMLVLLLIHRRRRTELLDFALQPFVLAFWCGLAAFYGWLHSVCFIELKEWPRDSFAAALVLVLESLAFVVLGVRRAILMGRAKRGDKAARFVAIHKPDILRPFAEDER